MQRSPYSIWHLTLLVAITFVPRFVEAQDHPTKLASEAYLSVDCDPAVGELTDGQPDNGSTIVQRKNWMPESDQRKSYFAKSPINHFSWKDLAISFTPKNSGTVTLELYGPWEKAPAADIYRQDVDWDDVRVTGATLKNGGFEEPLDARDSPWKSTGGTRTKAEPDSPSAEGLFIARTWHNQRVIAAIAVTAGKPVTIRAKARAIQPAGFVEMLRIAARDTAAHQAARKLRRGANLGNHLEVPPDQNWSLDYSDEDYDHIRDEGFDHVRLPIGWHHYTGPAPEYRLSDAIYAKVDRHVARAQQRKLAMIINVHHFDDFTTDPTQEKERFAAIWSQLAEHYANAPDTVFFELLNEPKDAATTVVMNPIFADIVRLIRRTNPTRTILIGPGLWNSVSQLTNLRLPDDDQNIIVTVHNYDPFQFTHQGATWAGPDVSLKGIRFPGPPAKPLMADQPDKLTHNAREFLIRYNTSRSEVNPCSPASLKDVVAQAKSWSEYYGRPVHFGEFGAYIEADAQSRANYVRAFRQAFDDADLGWAIWDWKAGFRYWDPEKNQPATGFREALFPKEQK